MYRLLLSLVCLTLTLASTGCAQRGQVRFDAEAGFEQDQDFFASRTPLSPQATENLRFHVVSELEVLDPVSIGGEETYRLVNTDIMIPIELQDFFPASALIPSRPDTSQYTKLGWFDISVGSGIVAGNAFDSNPAARIALHQGHLTENAGIVWMALELDSRESLQEIVNRMTVVAADYGGDAIINIILARKKIFAGGKTSKSLVFTLTGDVVRFR